MFSILNVLLKEGSSSFQLCKIYITYKKFYINLDIDSINALK